MNNEQLEMLFGLLIRQSEALERIANVLESKNHHPKEAEAPELEYPLERFHSFDWDSIGAIVEKTDDDGVAIVNWNGRLFLRRTKEKFGKDIWFSRAKGKKEDGEIVWEILIRFKPMVEREVSPLSNKVKQLISAPQAQLKSAEPPSLDQLIEAVGRTFYRLNYTDSQASNFIFERFGVRTRKELSVEQLIQLQNTLSKNLATNAN